MSTVKLSISKNYVPNWSAVDAIREIFQNSLDQSIINPDNVMEVKYNEDIQELKISSSKSMLTRESLLLGSSTKSEDSRLIGQHGEGYKLSLMVLVRLGFDVRIMNYKAKELWTPVLRYSRDFKSEVLNIDIKKHVFTSVPNADLTFSIYGVYPELYDAIKQSNLHLRDTAPLVIETKKGQILLEESERNNVYINGLFVQTIKDDGMKYGYNLKPEVLTLDRDRKMVQSIDLYWITSEMWKSTESINAVNEMLKSDSSDVRYLHYQYTETASTLLNGVFEKFIEEHGSNAHPVTTQLASETLVSTYEDVKPVFVTEAHKYAIESSPTYIRPYNKIVREQTPYEMLREFAEDFCDSVDSDEMFKILEASKKWMWK